MTDFPAGKMLELVEGATKQQLARKPFLHFENQNAV
jgi:hypothetical protein